MAAAVDIPPPPPGFTLDQTGGDVPPPPPGFTLDAPVQQQAAPVQPEKPPSLLAKYLKSGAHIGGPMEIAANLGSNMIGAPIAGLAGLGAAATNAVGLTNTPAADVVERVSSAFNYEPRTAVGKAGAAAISYPFQKLQQGADWVGDKVNNPSVFVPTPYGLMQGGPALATTLNTGIQSAPALLTRGAPKSKPAALAKPVAKAPEITPRQALADELIAKGLKITPTQAGAKAGSIVEGLTGHAKVERMLSRDNAPEVNRFVGEDVGLKNAKSITEADINKLMIEANKPYGEIARTGSRKTSDAYRQEVASIADRTGGESFKFDVPKDISKLKRDYGRLPGFTAQDAINKIRQLRKEATSNIKAPNAPEQNAKGHVQRAIADALDNELARHVEELGKPELAANYKAARVQLAKLHTLQDALEGSNISARSLAQAKERGVPLTGNMDLVARAYAEFDRSFQDVGKIRDSAPYSGLDFGAASLAAATANPLLLTTIAARPLARAYLGSKGYQRRLSSGSKSKAPANKTAPPANALAKPAVNALSAKENRK